MKNKFSPDNTNELLIEYNFFLSACFSALRSLIAVDLMGLEKLTNAFGILMLFQGLAAVMGSMLF